MIDDLLLLTEGDRVAADAVLLSCNDLMADESILTGESAPVRKQAGRKQQTANLGGTISHSSTRARYWCKAVASGR